MITGVTERVPVNVANWVKSNHMAFMQDRTELLAC